MADNNQRAPQQTDAPKTDDRTAKLAELNKQISALTEERDRLMGGE